MHNHSHINKHTSILLPVLLLVIDYLAVILAEEVAYALRNVIVPNGGTLHISWLNFWVTFPFLYLIFISLKQPYNRRVPFYKLVENIFYSTLYAIGAIIGVLYVVQITASTSRLFIALLWVFSFVFLVIFRYLAKKYFARLGILQTRILIIGAGKTAEAFVNEVVNDAGMGYEVVGLLEDNDVTGELKKYKVLGTFKDAERIIKETGVQHVVICAPGLEQEKLTQLIQKVQPLVKYVGVIPNLIATPMNSAEIESLFESKLMMVRLKNNLVRPFNRVVKRLFDIVATVLGGLLILPILLLVVIKIKKDSPGRVIYDGERIGQNGKLFKCYKFRSMYVNGDEILEKYLKENPDKRKEWEVYHKLDDDPRVTNFGKFMRKTSIDELPQLINVLKGEMSLVGPRPYLPREADEMGEAVNTIILAKPGITGYWQVNGRSDVDFASRLKMDCWYIHNWNFFMDLVLLVKTVAIVLNRKGAK